MKTIIVILKVLIHRNNEHTIPTEPVKRKNHPPHSSMTDKIAFKTKLKGASNTIALQLLLTIIKHQIKYTSCFFDLPLSDT